MCAVELISAPSKTSNDCYKEKNSIWIKAVLKLTKTQ